jgi:MEDS: MEthanogen/methylotroph, DcmR Sensory domain
MGLTSCPQLAAGKVAAVLSAGPAGHVLVFYHSEDELAEHAADYLIGAMKRDGAAIVIAAPRHQQALRMRLASGGVDIAQARARGSYSELDAAETIARFMVNGWADPAGFWQAIAPLVKASATGGRRVRIFGEMVALLWQQGLVSAAVDVEALWNELGAQYPFQLLCAYPEAVLSDHEHADAIAQVRGAHAAPARATASGN